MHIDYRICRLLAISPTVYSFRLTSFSGVEAYEYYKCSCWKPQIPSRKNCIELNRVICVLRSHEGLTLETSTLKLFKVVNLHFQLFLHPNPLEKLCLPEVNKNQATTVNFFTLKEKAPDVSSREALNNFPIFSNLIGLSLGTRVDLNSVLLRYEHLNTKQSLSTIYLKSFLYDQLLLML